MRAFREHRRRGQTLGQLLRLDDAGFLDLLAGRIELDDGVEELLLDLLAHFGPFDRLLRRAEEDDRGGDGRRDHCWRRGIAGELRELAVGDAADAVCGVLEQSREEAEVGSGGSAGKILLDCKLDAFSASTTIGVFAIEGRGENLRGEAEDFDVGRRDGFVLHQFGARAKGVAVEDAVDIRVGLVLGDDAHDELRSFAFGAVAGRMLVVELDAGGLGPGERGEVLRRGVRLVGVLRGAGDERVRETAVRGRPNLADEEPL